MSELINELEFDTRQRINAENSLSLVDKIKRAKYRKVMAADAEHTKELMAGADPTIGMSTAEKLGAGFQSGLRRVGRGAGNMVGLIDDEAVTEANQRDSYLGDTGAGAVGQFVGETAALAPLAAPGRLAAAASKSSRLPSALRALGQAGKAGTSGRGAAGLARAAAGAGAAGAVLANPNERFEGARDAALTGAALNQTLGRAARKFGRGFDENDAATAFGKETERLLGRSSALPVAQSASSRMVQYPHRSVLSMFPLARGGSTKMNDLANDDFAKSLLVQTFGVKNRDAVENAVSKANGDMVTAGHELLRTMGNKGFAANRKVLKEMLDNMKAGELITPNKIDSAAKKFAKGESRPFYTLSSNYSKIMEEPLEESTVSGRRLFNKIQNAAVPASLGAALTGGVLPYVAVTAATKAATAAPMQNFMMGRTGANRQITKSAESMLAEMLRNSMAAGE